MPRAIAVAVALAVAPVLIAVALLALVHPWTADVAYVLPGFPEPRIELSDRERSRLAGVGTRAIQPWRGDGIQAMRAARLEDGRSAFAAEELRHFSDVRDLVARFLIAGAAGAALIAVALVLVSDRKLVQRAIAAGAKGTLAVLVAAAAIMLIGFEAFFDTFHGVFFEGSSWRLPNLGTVRSLYPDEFWGLMGGAMAALVIGQAALTLALLRRRSSSPR